MEEFWEGLSLERKADIEKLIPTSDLEYADDTLLMALAEPEMQELFNLVEQRASEVGLELNETKCHIEVVKYKGKQTGPAEDCKVKYGRHVTPFLIRFLNGKKVSSVEDEVYLGGRIQRTRIAMPEIKERLRKARAKMHKLRKVWRGRGLTKQRKSRIFHACITPIVCYNLDTLTMTAREEEHLNAQQAKMLRTSLWLKPQSMDRSFQNSAQSLLEDFKLPKWSETVARARWRMFKEVVMSDCNGALFRSIFQVVDVDDFHNNADSSHLIINKRTEASYCALRKWGDGSSFPPFTRDGCAHGRERWIDQVVHWRGVSLQEAIAQAVADSEKR